MGKLKQVAECAARNIGPSDLDRETRVQYYRAVALEKGHKADWIDDYSLSDLRLLAIYAETNPRL